MLKEKTENIKTGMAVVLRNLGESAMLRCFFPFVESEPEAPKCILEDVEPE